MSPGPVLVSVIVPTYGRPTFLAECISSIEQQTWPNVECIVVDDCSPEPASAPGWVTLIRHAQNQGPAAARNTGLAHAHGQLLTFVDDDDWLLPERLAWAVDGIGDAHAHACQTEPRSTQEFKGDLRAIFCRAPFPAMGQVVHRREDVLQFDPMLRVTEDAEWWVRMRDSTVFAWDPRIGHHTRIHEERRPAYEGRRRYEARCLILRKHGRDLDRPARAWLRIRSASEALNAGLYHLAVWRAVQSMLTHPTKFAVKVAVLSILRATESLRRKVRGGPARFRVSSRYGGDR